MTVSSSRTVPPVRKVRTPKGRASTSPTVSVDFRDTPEYRFKCQAEDTLSALRDAALEVVWESREIGPHRVLCAIGKMEGGTERVLMAFVANGQGEFIARIGPLDPDGVMWLSTTMAAAYEQSRHRTLLDAVDAARAEAVERHAWTANSYDAVQAAYAANPRQPMCEHCGR